MGLAQNRLSALPAGLLVGILLFLPAAFSASGGQRTDEVYLAAILEDRLQRHLDTIVGTEKTMVQVEITLARPMEVNEIRWAGILRQLPGVVTSREEPNEASAAMPEMLTSTITKMDIVVWADDKLPEESIRKIRDEVPRWARLQDARGDTFQVTLTPWRETLPLPADGHENYLLYSILALGALLILIAAIYFPIRRFKTSS